MSQILTSGVQIAENLKTRCGALRKLGYKINVKMIFAEAGLSYLTYKSWQGGRCEPRMRTFQKVNAVLAAHEAKAGVNAENPNH